jgi:cAMP phosphodiesterase
MKIRILGAHHFETGPGKYTCFVIDGILAVDAGAITSTLSAEQQQALKGILVTHAHFDHIRDIPSVAANMFSAGRRITVYATENTRQAIQSHLLNNVLYPDFSRLPVKAPTLVYERIVPGEVRDVLGYSVLPLPTTHCEDALAYEISDKKGSVLFYSGDSGPGLSIVWPRTSPQTAIIEVTLPNRLHDFALESGHLTPGLLRHELEEFRRIKGYLPAVVTIHMDRMHEEDIRRELDEVSRALDADIVLAHEGLEIGLP